MIPTNFRNKDKSYDYICIIVIKNKNSFQNIISQTVPGLAAFHFINDHQTRDRVVVTAGRATSRATYTHKGGVLGRLPCVADFTKSINEKTAQSGDANPKDSGLVKRFRKKSKKKSALTTSSQRKRAGLRESRINVPHSPVCRPAGLAESTKSAEMTGPAQSCWAMTSPTWSAHKHHIRFPHLSETTTVQMEKRSRKNKAKKAKVRFSDEDTPEILTESSASEEANPGPSRRIPARRYTVAMKAGQASTPLTIQPDEGKLRWQHGCPLGVTHRTGLVLGESYPPPPPFPLFPLLLSTGDVFLLLFLKQ